MPDSVTSVIIAGLGGQGVLTSSDILGDVVFGAGMDVKKAEVHGMAQRGGSVTSEVRFGERVLSPMTPAGEADFLISLADSETDLYRARLKSGGVVIAPDAINAERLEHPRSLNVALLGALSARLPQFDTALWLEAIRGNLKPSIHELNERAFALGREGVAA